MIKVVFFAALREQLDCSELNIDSDKIDSVADVKQQLITLHPNWQGYLENSSLLTAVNNEMVNASCQVKSGDELAFFPPVTGG